MKLYPSTNIKNIGIYGHSGSGKTTLVENLLFTNKLINRIGKVEDENTVSDFYPEEHKRKVSVNTSLIPIEWNNYKINLLDTPGYNDFIGEVYSTFPVIDSALFVLCGVGGVEVQTEIIWNALKDVKIPKIFLINKLDRENSNFNSVLMELKKKFQSTFVPIYFPLKINNKIMGFYDVLQDQIWKQDNENDKDFSNEIHEINDYFIEKIVELDDDILEKYLNGEDIDRFILEQIFYDNLHRGNICPVLGCISNLANNNIAILDYFTKMIPDKVIQHENLAAQVFKTINDPYMGRLSLIKVYSGTLRADETVYNPSKEKNEKIGQILWIRGKHQQVIKELVAGDIGAVAKLQHTSTGDVLSKKGTDIEQEVFFFPKPTYSLAISPKTKGDEDKLGVSLLKLAEEDQTFKIEKNPETKQTIISGLGNQHLEVIIERLERKFGVEIITHDLVIPYRETIKKLVKVEGKHKKQTGGHGQYGHVWLNVEPYSEEFLFEEKIFGGSVPKQYFPAVEKGIREAKTEGVFGYPVMNIKVTLLDGSYHSVDSSELAFKIAASQAFKKAIQQAQPVLLEPIMKVVIETNKDYLGDIITDINGKRGKIMSIDTQENNKIINAQIPYAELTQYTIDLKSISQGKSNFTMELDHYEEVSERFVKNSTKN